MVNTKINDITGAAHGFCIQLFEFEVLHNIARFFPISDKS